MSIIDHFRAIDLALIELAKNHPERLEALKRHHLELIEDINKKLNSYYTCFDHVYIKIGDEFPNFEKDLLELENLKIKSENKVKEIERLIRENRHTSEASTSASTSATINEQ